MTLTELQKKIKVPKNRMNSFGHYNYRSQEDILIAIKPLLSKEDELIIGDEVVLVGDRIYVKATIKLKLGDKEYTNSAFARESNIKKGMDDSQITGTASSYARKYALNGLLLIDDVKDADTDEYKKQSNEPNLIAQKFNKETL